MNQLSEIIKKITGLTSDSRHVRPGFLFSAISGTHTDGSQFVQDALNRGASMIMGDKKLKDQIPSHIPFIETSNPRKKLSKLASLFYFPQPKNIVAVTGTNGKTSITSFYRMLMESQGHPSVSIGTLGIIGHDIQHGNSLTTPDPVFLHQKLHELKSVFDIDYVAIEASSHGLDMYRLDGLVLQAAAFTNLTQDHLDYHENLNNYRACKLRLFEELLPVGKTSVVCSSAREFDAISDIAYRKKHKLISYGLHNGQVSCIESKPLKSGFLLKLRVMGYIFHISFPLIGMFQIENALGALALAIGSGADIHSTTTQLSNLSCIPGRLDFVGKTKKGAYVYVDYAHTPDAIRVVLQSLRLHTKGRLIIVFGCGGDRDKDKRFLMGVMAQKYADLSIITDDNPRFEDPYAIYHAILKGCPEGQIIPNRQDAIFESIALAKNDDVIIVAGKGHENYQVIQGNSVPFSDFEVIKNALDL